MANLLLVDDEVEITDFLTEALSSDYTIDAVRSAEEVFSFFEKKIPDIVIVDIQMGEMDGVTLVEKLQDLYRDRGVRYILLSGHMDAGYMERWLNLFERPIFFSKPVSVDTLYRAIESLLEDKNTGV